MQPPKSNICVLCGVRPATTHDHVPPKGFFKGLGAQLITVPACAECNNGASADDEDLRFFISAQVGKQSPGSAMLWDKGAHPSVLRKRTLRESVLNTKREIPVVEADGGTSNRLAFEAPLRIYQSVFERTTRGLHFFHTGEILPAATRVAVEPLYGVPTLEGPDFAKLQVHSIGGEACVYRFAVEPTAKVAGLWLYSFYGTHWVMVATGDTAEAL